NRLKRKKKKARPEHDLASWAKPPKLNYPVPDLLPGWRRRWCHDLLVLRASPESQCGDQNGHDHDHFQKFQSISPPFAASCTARLGSHGNNVSLVSFGCIARRFRPKLSWSIYASITTGVLSPTKSNSSITSALRIRTQPQLAGVPILSSCLVP